MEFGGRTVRPEYLWEHHRKHAPSWLKGYLRVPADANPPLAMSPVHPEAVGSYGPVAIRWIKAQVGIDLRWWQRLAVVRQLEHRDDGSLCWGDVVESASRRVGKSVRLRSMALWRLEVGPTLFQEPQLAIHTGKDLAIVREIQRGAWRWAEEHGWRVVKAIGRESVENGEHRWLARGTDSVYGYDVTLGMVDEGWDVKPDTVSEGMEPAVLERISPQIVVTSTAHRRATSLMRSRITDAMAADSALLLLWAAPDGADPGDPEVWRAASAHWSPARLKLMQSKWDKALRGESDQELDDPDPVAGFESQYLNRWQLRVGAGGALPNWGNLVSMRVPPQPEALGIAADPSGSWFALGAYADGFVAPVERARSEIGRSLFVKRVADYCSKYDVRVAVAAKGMAGPLIVDLEDAGVPVVATTFEDHVQASADFADLVETSMIAHAGSPELDAAVLMSRWRKQGDRRSLDVRVGDVSMLEAVALAAWLGRASYDPLDSVAGTGDWQPEPGEEPGEDYDVTDSIA
jgi:hypothetical protein